LVNEIQEAALFLFINSEFSTEEEGKERPGCNRRRGGKSITSYSTPLPSSACIAASSES
jgi:hypothetical protein